MLMSSRPLEIAAFLDQHGWGDAHTESLTGDFSTRRYARLTKPSGETAFLMDADESQKTPAFVALADLLRGLGLKAPRIYAAAPAEGLVLMEDFGSQNVGALLDEGAPPKSYYLRAAGVLAKLHTSFDPESARGLNLPLYNAALFAEQTGLFLDFYFPSVTGRDATEDERADFRAAWKAVLRPLETMPKSLLLRDFMPDNLMDLSPPFARKKGEKEQEQKNPLPLEGRVREGGVPLKTRLGIINNLQAIPSIVTKRLSQSFSPLPNPPREGEGILSGPETLGLLDFQDAGIGPVAYDLASLCEEIRRDGGFALLPEVIAHYRATAQTPLSEADLLRACKILSAQRHTRVLGIVARLAATTNKQDKLAFLPRIRCHMKNLLSEPFLLPVRTWFEPFGDLLS